jgi:DNA-binding XRE family transcriptional regulator
MESGAAVSWYMKTIPIIIVLLALALLSYITYLIIKALQKYIKSEPVRKEKAANAKSLGDVIKQHRVECKMTQEFVAETIGVSRQAVSKWESGKSDPSTTNLIALAKLFGVAPEELLKETK